MRFRFNLEKTIQATALLLELNENCMSKARLLKLLYITDRELLTEGGSPLTGDVAIAMRHGPVLFRVYDLVKGIVFDASWKEHFHTSGYKILLKKKPGRQTLTKGETEKLIDVTSRYNHMGDDELSDLLQEFKEWANHSREGVSSPIPWIEILIVQGKEDLIPIIEEDETDRQSLGEVFGPPK